MKDILGHALQVGDTVVHSGGRYKNLSFGTVIKVTAQTATLQTQHQANLGKKTLRVESNQVMKM